MLDVAFDELPACAARDLRAQQARVGVHERHDVLQLITKPDRLRPIGRYPLRAHSRHAIVWYTSQPLASTLRPTSGVSICTASSTWRQ